MQVLPELDVGGVERGTVEIAQALVAAGHRAIVVSGGGRLVSELEDCGVLHVQLDVGAKRLRSLSHMRALAALYREHAVDIVHARSRLPAWLAWFARSRLERGVRPAWVTTVHGPYSVNRYSHIMVSGQAVIAISAFIRDYILANYADVGEERISVIHRGIDPRRYYHGYVPDQAWLGTWARERPELQGKVVLTLPGRLTRWKGQLDFIALVAELRRREPAVHGLIVGAAHAHKPHFEAVLKRAAADAGIADAVSFLGNRSDLREILAISDCAFSLTEEPEAFGRTTIEALSLGTPVVGYDHGGTGEILARVFPQGLVRPRDISAAADCTQSVLRDGARALEDHPYTTAAMQAATLALYARVKESRNTS